jgi:hypothetical protein
MICEHGVLGMCVRRYRKRCPESHAWQSGSHAIRRQTLVHAQHPHPHIYIRTCWPGNLILPVDLVAQFWFLNPAMALQLRARPFAKILAKVKPSCWVRQADATYAAPGGRTAWLPPC